MPKMDAQSIINYISNSKKKTPVKVYISADMGKISVPDNVKEFASDKMGILFGDWSDIQPVLENNKDQIDDYEIENHARNSGVPLLNLKNQDARIEPGAIIREKVAIGHNAVVMMGAIINIGAEIGDDTMIDMGVVMGGRAIVGKHSHIGAGAVLAGVVEPASAKPVQIDDNVLVGANAVVIEGVHVGEGAVVAAGAIVTHDVAPHTLVAGTPARKIKDIDAKTKSKTGLQDALRKL
ncbi:2,3,4,5-tetrahydropyridine-2,6-dicarboxylate N-acetyltransferase [Philodulcilactobacillus myokoensis]|uniref:2,3,4,5-tetrahydropyridine-2,6-dicarboxylate N-acetyltransferase n=1 Tax=Philodulcilactobacillus myokoensis TaxID=2929573 RepID=A0A9W6B0X9_9LACO|nr:2,3,4,5-tetrahydropyridine-2,6-dicarboxylate N-acetyltransferase [Philodulcilactobacillus myokoensis]GLB46531.1 2,3,4,5-tetrahydropyridine-2,6-dicarboxylate N-acetyltransferase [Philodulcilactobacillus myokoensis]